MTKIITTIAFFVCSLLSAQGQFEQGMGKAFQLWGQGKNTEASDMFERISAVEKTSWLPNYYVALINATAAFQTKDKEQINLLLAKAQKALDFEMVKNPNNAELLVVQDTKPMCAQIEKAIGLFATFKPETAFSPTWGLDRATVAAANCK